MLPPSDGAVAWAGQNWSRCSAAVQCSLLAAVHLCSSHHIYIYISHRSTLRDNGAFETCRRGLHSFRCSTEGSKRSEHWFAAQTFVGCSVLCDRMSGIDVETFEARAAEAERRLAALEGKESHASSGEPGVLDTEGLSSNKATSP